MTHHEYNSITITALIGSHTLRVKCNYLHTVLMIRKARNRISISSDFGRRQLNGDVAINRIPIRIT